MVFTPGKTGNPNGRPKKGNTLTDILNASFDEARLLYPDRDPINTKRLLAEYVRGAITKGEVDLVTGTKFKFSPETWMDLVKWAYNRLDGNPAQPLDGATGAILHFDAIPTVQEDYQPTEEPIDVTDELV
jgi:hypothetical protein